MTTKVLETTSALPDQHDHPAGVPLLSTQYDFAKPFNPAAEEIILGYLEFPEVIDLAGSAESPIKNDPTVQKVVAQERKKNPEELKHLQEMQRKEFQKEITAFESRANLWSYIFAFCFLLTTLSLIAGVVLLCLLATAHPLMLPMIIVFVVCGVSMIPTMGCMWIQVELAQEREKIHAEWQSKKIN